MNWSIKFKIFYFLNIHNSNISPHEAQSIERIFFEQFHQKYIYQTHSDEEIKKITEELKDKGFLDRKKMLEMIQIITKGMCKYKII